MLAARERKPIRTATLFGAAKGLRERHGVPLVDPWRRAEARRARRSAQRKLRGGAFTEAEDAGRALPLSQAIDMARESE